MGKRGVSPVVGYALLLGIAALLTVSLLVVAGTVIGDLESSAQREQAESAMSEFSESAQTVGEGSKRSEEFALAGDERSTTWVDEDAGNVRIVVVNGSDRDVLTNRSLGAYRQELSDGTELAYQGGGVFRRGERGGVVVVESPALDYRQSPVPTLNFPNVIVSGDATGAGEISGELSVDNASERTLDVENPVTGDYVALEVASRYCQGWEEHVRDRTDGAVEESCDTAGSHTDLGELRVNLSVGDVNVTRDPGEDPTPGEPPKTVLNGSYGLYAEEQFYLDSTGGDVNGTVGAGDTVTVTNSGYGNLTTVENVSHERTAHDEEIQDLVEATDSQPDRGICEEPDGSCEYTAGTYRITDFDPSHNDVTFNLSDGDIRLVYPGDARLAGNTWTVEGHENGSTLEVYVAGDLVFESGSAEIGTPPGPGPTEMDDPVDEPPEDPNAEAVQFYVRSDSTVRMESATVQIEGSISAPSAGTGNSSQFVSAASSSLTLLGAIHAAEVDVRAASFDAYQDSDVATKEFVRKGTPPEEGSEGMGRTVTFASGDEDLYYLHVSETVVEIED